MKAMLVGKRVIDYKKKSGEDVHAVELYFMLAPIEGTDGYAVKSFYINPSYCDEDVFSMVESADVSDVFELGFMQNRWGNEVLYKLIPVASGTAVIDFGIAEEVKT